MLETLKNRAVKFLKLLKPQGRLGRVSFVILGSLVISSFFMFVIPARANVVADALASIFANIVLFFAGLFMQIAIFCLKFVIEIAAYNGYIDSTPVALGWTLVRDISNMFFVIILLVIAFATVIGLENYSWKKLLMKFVMAAVLVNFSRVICGVIIDASQVFMMTFINGVAATAGGNLTQALNLDKILSWSSSADPSKIENYTVIGTAMAATFFAALAAFIVGAYLVMLVIRAVVLWVLIILSPLAFVLNVIPKTQAYAGKWWTTFGNEVIAGPILVFFLWLSFAVAGNGELHREIDNSVGDVNKSYSLSGSIDDLKAESESMTNKNLKTETGETLVAGGLGEFMEWEQMASFIISAALLLVGIKVTQELSTVGGGIMGGIVDFGKKAAMVASGVAAARYLTKGAAVGVGKGVAGAAKYVAMKAPLGGEFWQRRGMDVAGRFMKGKAELDLKRNLRSGELEAIAADKTKGTAAGRFWAGMKANLIETGAKKRKKVEGWEQAVKNLEETNDAYSSVSKSAGGAAKDETRIRLEQAKVFRDTKGAQKGAEGMKKLLETEFGRAREDVITKTKLKGEAQKAEIQTMQEKELTEEREKQMESFKPKTQAEIDAMSREEKGKYEMQYGRIMERAADFGAEKKIIDIVGEGRKVIRERDAMDKYVKTERAQPLLEKFPKLKAEGDYRTLQSDRGTQEDVAAATREYVRAQKGMSVDFLARKREEFLEEDIKKSGASSSTDEAEATFARAAEDMNTRRARLEKMDKNSDDYKREKEVLKNFRKEFATRMFADTKNDAWNGLSARDGVIKASGLKMHDVGAEENSANNRAQIANELQLLLNKPVEATEKGIEDAFEEMRELFGDESGLLQFRKMEDNLGDAGFVRHAALTTETVDANNNRVVKPLIDIDSNKDVKDQVKLKKDMSRAATSGGGKNGLKAAMDFENERVFIHSAQARKNIALPFKGITGQNIHNVGTMTWRGLAEALNNSSKGGEKHKGDIANFIQEASHTIVNPQGFQAFLSNLQTALKNIGSNVKINMATPHLGGIKESFVDNKKATKNKPLDKVEEQESRVANDKIAEKLEAKLGATIAGMTEVIGKALKEITDNIAQSAQLDAKGLTDNILNAVKGLTSTAGVNIDEKVLAEAIAEAMGDVLKEHDRFTKRKKAAEDAKDKKG